MSQNNLDYGPLQALIGHWQGNIGADISPEEDGIEENHYQETLIFEPMRYLDNAETQDLVALSYHQVVTRIRDGKLIHSEAGFYSWNAEQNLLMKSFSIPRGVAVVAGGSAEYDKNNGLSISVNAAKNNKDWSIVESPFMQKNATTKSYEFSLQLKEQKLTYRQTMHLHIYGRDFDHTDVNELVKVRD